MLAIDTDTHTDNFVELPLGIGVAHARATPANINCMKLAGELKKFIAAKADDNSARWEHVRGIGPNRRQSD